MGGNDRTNAIVQWAAAEVRRRYGVQVEHVKLTDTAEAAKRVRSEKLFLQMRLPELALTKAAWDQRSFKEPPHT